MKSLITVLVVLLAGCAGPVCHIEASKDESLTCAGLVIDGKCVGGYQRTGSLLYGPKFPR